MLFDKVSRDHILKGIKDYDLKGLPNGFGPSSTYDVIFKEKKYPPKAIMAYANFYAIGRKIENYFEGGSGTDCFLALEKNGFKIIEKNVNTKLVENYLLEFAEVAKDWFDKQDWLEGRYNFFKEFFNQEKIDKYEWDDFQKLKDNLHSFTSMPLAGANALGRPNLPIEKYRQIFQYIISEKDDISFTINNLVDRYKGEYILPYFGESTVTELMQYAYPEKYIVYNSRTESALNLLGIKFKRKRGEKIGEKFKRFNDLVSAVVKKYNEIVGRKTNTTIQLEVDQFFSWLYENKIPKDISINSNYWIFQGNPKIYDVKAALGGNAVKTWNVKVHKDEISVGDKVIIWVTGKDSGCYALGEVTSDLFVGHDEQIERQFYTEKSKVVYSDEEMKLERTRVRIKITHNISEAPISKNTLLEFKEFDEFKGGNQGTNFSATKEQYNILLDLIESKNSSDYQLVKNNFPKDKIDQFIQLLRKFVQSTNLNPDDERISFNIRKSRNRLVFIIGSRYAFMIEQNKHDTFYSFISNNKLSSEFGQFHDRQGNPENVFWNKIDNVKDFENQIFEGLKLELERNYISPYRRFSNKDFKNDVYNISDYNTDNKHYKNKMNIPLNTIFYGPPGTGKTYKLKNEYFKKFTIKEVSLTKNQYLENIVKDLTWWQVISIAVLDINTPGVDEIFKHKFVQKKAELSNSKTVRQTIWNQLQRHAVLECENVKIEKRTEPLLFYKRKNSTWTVNHEFLHASFPEAFELLEKIERFQPNPDKEVINYEFITFHQSFAYEDFIEGIKPVMDDNTSELNYELTDGVFKKLCLRAKANPEHNYALFIDEINRGNVSAIFGELISLIEEDKRIGAANELKSILPYSKQEFGVPKNLFIYGTMNTADRSVEAIDTALRRRFSFEEIMPDYAILESESIDDIQLAVLLEKINNRVEILVDRDHQIGHSYFINVKTKAQLAQAFNDKIVPLLQEYFYGDYGKIGLVLGKGFVEKIKNDKIEFASFDYEGQNDFKTPTFKLKKLDETNVMEAIKGLLARNED